MALEFHLLPNLILFAYFSAKNYFVYEKLKLFEDKKLDALLALLVSAANIFLNYLLARSYYFHLNLLPTIAGLNWLPPFTAFFIGADLLGTIITFVHLYRFDNLKGQSYKLFYEMTRLVVTYIVFILLVGHFWLRVPEENRWAHYCLKHSLRKDLAQYYFEHGSFPAKIELASDLTTHPLNKSDLIIKNHDDVLELIVVDGFENEIIKGYEDFHFIEGFRDGDHSAAYMQSLEIFEIFCD